MNDKNYQVSKSQWAIAGIIAACAGGVIFYRLLKHNSLEQTAALYVGLPALMAIIVTLTPKAKSSYGMAFKTVTIALLGSMIFWGEGFVCILFAAPIFYLVAFLVVAISSYVSRKRRNARLHGLLLLPILLASLEGALPGYSFNRSETVVSETLIAASVEEVEFALSLPLRFDQDQLPLFLSVGFPFPTESRGGGSVVGDDRRVLYSFQNDREMELRFEIIDRREGYMRMQPVLNTTVFANWLDIGDSEISWVPVGKNQTLVTWTIHYERLLDPAWYFGPIENYAMHLVADYLILSQASP